MWQAKGRRAGREGGTGCGIRGRGRPYITINGDVLQDFDPGCHLTCVRACVRVCVRARPSAYVEDDEMITETGVYFLAVIHFLFSFVLLNKLILN